MKIRDIIKTDKLITISPNVTLTSALSMLASSHDTAFVFSENKFLGIINPYYCMIKNSYPANTKVEHCLYHPPKIRANYPISKVAQLMIESKVHYLPVFDDKDHFSGIISARRLISALSESPVFKVPIRDVLKNKKQSLISIYEQDFISTAIAQFKKNKVSKLVVVDKEMKVRGVISHYDLITFLVAPKVREQKSERDANKVNLVHQKVKNFLKSFVLTLNENQSVGDALKLIIEKKIGSVVIFSNLKKPVGIITTKDLLGLLARDFDRKKIEVVSKNLSEENRKIIGSFFTKLSLWVKKIPDITKAKLFVKEEKQGGLFEVVLSLIPKKGNPKVIKKEGKNLQKVLKKFKKE